MIQKTTGSGLETVYKVSSSQTSRPGRNDDDDVFDLDEWEYIYYPASSKFAFLSSYHHIRWSVTEIVHSKKIVNEILDQAGVQDSTTHYRFASTIAFEILVDAISQNQLRKEMGQVLNNGSTVTRTRAGCKC